jgi:hypothetical protein
MSASQRQNGSWSNSLSGTRPPDAAAATRFPVAIGRSHTHEPHGFAEHTVSPANPFVAKVAVYWATLPIFGMQFVNMNDDNRSLYNEWLASMTLL